MIVGFFYSDYIQALVMKPVIDISLINFQLQDIKITSPFMVKIVIALFSSLIVSFPYIIFEASSSIKGLFNFKLPKLFTA